MQVSNLSKVLLIPWLLAVALNLGCTGRRSNTPDKSVGSQTESLPGYLRDRKTISSTAGGTLDVGDARITFGPGSAAFDFDGVLAAGSFPTVLPGSVIAHTENRAIAVTGEYDSAPMSPDSLQKTFLTILYVDGANTTDLRIVVTSIDDDRYPDGAIVPAQFTGKQVGEDRIAVSVSSRLIGYWMQVVRTDTDLALPEVDPALLADVGEEILLRPAREWHRQVLGTKRRGPARTW